MTRADMAREHIAARESFADAVANGDWDMAEWWADRAFIWAERAKAVA